MITIDFNSFWFDQDELKKSCIEFVERHAGPSEKITILKDDENDPESSYSILFKYGKYTLTNFEFYDNLKDFAEENELYVVVYDHNTKQKKGFWYDEEDDWIVQNVTNDIRYSE